MHPQRPTQEEALSQVRNWSERSRPRTRAQVVTIPFIIGTGAAVISTGVQAAIPIFFNGRIVKIQLQEFDGITGSITLDIRKFVGGVTPTPVSVIGAGGAIPTINVGRFYSDDLLGNWSTNVTKGDYLMLVVSTVTSFQRLSVALAFRRK